MKITKKEWAAIKSDLKRTMQEIEAAIARKDYEFLDELALQLSASSLNLHSETRAEAN